jgi:hypothetical protein
MQRSARFAVRHRQGAQVAGIGAGPADGRERRAQLPAGAIEDVGCIPEVATVQKQDRELHVALRPMQRLARLLAAVPREPREAFWPANLATADTIFNATCARSFR